MVKIKEKIKAIIFDMDGTIIHSEHIWDNAVSQTLKDQGPNVSDQEMAELSCILGGMGLDKSLAFLKDKYNLEKHVHELVAEAKAYAAEEFAKGMNFMPGFEEFHKKLILNQIPSCIATNCDGESLEKISSSMKLETFFGEHIYCLSHVNNRPKPDPALFLYAAKKLNVAPHECVVFEDSIHGFKAAKSAGMKCIAIKNKINEGLLHHVEDSIEHYDLALEVLNKILNRG